MWQNDLITVKRLDFLFSNMHFWLQPISINCLTVHAGASGLHRAGYFSFNLSFSLFGSISSSLSDTQRYILDFYKCNVTDCIAEHFMSSIPLLDDGTERIVLITLRRLSVKVSWKQVKMFMEKTANTDWNTAGKCACLKFRLYREISSIFTQRCFKLVTCGVFLGQMDNEFSCN